MTVRRMLLSTVLAIPVSCVIGLQTVAQTYERPAFAHEKSDIKPDKRVVYGQLANGLRYAVMENKTPEGVAAMHLRFAVGSLNESEDVLGIAHYLEHMAFNGSKNIPEGEMVKRLERHGLSFGADTNAHTSFDETVYKLNLPTVDDAVVDEAFMIMRETASNLTLDQGAIDRERGIIFSEKRARNTSQFRRSIENLEFFTRGSGLVDRMPIGTDETIGSLHSDQFRAFYNANYHPEKAFLVFVGDVPTEAVIARIEATFGDWEGVGAPAPNPPELAAVSHRPGDVGYYFDPKMLPSVSFSVLQPFEERADTRANRRKALVEGLAVKLLSRRLIKLHYDLDSGVRFASSSRQSLYDLASVSSVNIIPASPEGWAKALASVEQTLRRALEFGFDREEFDRTIRVMRKGYEEAVKADGTRGTTGLFGGGLVGHIMSAYRNERVFENVRDARDRFEQDIATVTLEEVEQALRDMWKGVDDPMMYVVSPLAIEDTKTAVQEAFRLSRMESVEPGDELGKKQFAYTDFGPPGEIVERAWLPEIDAHTVRFANNVLLTVKQTDFQDNQINFDVKVGDGPLSLPRKDEGLRRLAANLLSSGGLEKHSQSDMIDITQDWMGAYGPSFGRDSDAISFSGVSARADFSNVLNAATAHLIAPGLREDAETLYKRQVAVWYPTHDATPSSVASAYVPRIIRSGDARFGLPSLDTFLSADRDEAVDWIQGQLADGMIEIAIVGDIAVEDAIAEVARTFGALPARKTSRDLPPEATVLRFPERGEDVIELTHGGEADKVLVQIYWPAPDGTDPERSWALNLSARVFGRKLLEEIREKEAVVYGTGAFYEGSSIFPGYGFVTMSMELEPKEVSRIIERAEAIAAEMYRGAISDDEFHRAMEPVKEDIPAWLQSNGYWIRTLIDAQSDRSGLAAHEAMLAAPDTLTIDDVRSVARGVFAPDRSIRIRIVPRTTEDDT